MEHAAYKGGGHFLFRYKYEGGRGVPGLFFKECNIIILSLYAANKETETERQNQWRRI